MGSTAYKAAMNLDYAEGECILEVGSCAGEDSTNFLALVAHERHVPFYTIDVDEIAFTRALSIKHCNAIHGRGEDVLSAWQFERPRFAWLDGYDWPYPFFPGTSEQVAAYARRGEYITEEASQASHFIQATALNMLMGPGAVIGFDDTWMVKEGEWTGKGGVAVPYLLGEGWTLGSYSHSANASDCAVIVYRS